MIDDRDVIVGQRSRWQRLRPFVGLVLSFPLFVACWALATFVRRLPIDLTQRLRDHHRRVTDSSYPDVRIPKDTRISAYMHRWWRLRLKVFGSIYYHLVMRSDDDRALHDHPWWSLSIVLEGGFYEHVIQGGGLHERRWSPPGTLTFRWTGRKAHRLELATDINGYDEEHELPARTIFITGPVTRRWGFHDPHRGWIDAKDWNAHCERHGILPGSSTFY